MIEHSVEYIVFYFYYYMIEHSVEYIVFYFYYYMIEQSTENLQVKNMDFVGMVHLVCIYL